MNSSTSLPFTFSSIRAFTSSVIVVTPSFGYAGGELERVKLAAHAPAERGINRALRSDEHTSELQSLMRISYAVFCLKNNINPTTNSDNNCTPRIAIITIYHSQYHLHKVHKYHQHEP